ncbi:MAG TPA: hypothetical protein VLX92_26935 [Kofleriaceae bacterium]|nr:hypothetical protein [Kofleriaceae bacterium]
MRRAVAPPVLASVLAIGALARADTWTVTGEAGSEVDTNVQRVETGPGLPDQAVTAPVARVGARLDGSGKLLGGGFSLAASDLTRVVPDGTVPVENVTLLGGDLRWMHPLGDRPVALGVGATAADALPLSDPIGDRTFSNLGADVLLQVHDDQDRRLLIAVGGRSFVYKPDHEFDYTGPSANARLDLVLWQSPARTRSLELAATVGFEARGYDSVALVNACSAGAPPDPSCTAATTRLRSDRFQRAGVDLTWSGHQIISLGYRATVIDSNSFGQSLVMHRVTGSVTSALPWSLYGTLLGVLEIDQYVDGLVVSIDTLRPDFANIDDENRSSLQLRLARQLSKGWSVEGRAAIWRNLAKSSMELAYRRELISVGVLYVR